MMKILLTFIVIVLLMQTVRCIKAGTSTDISKHPWQASINVKMSFSFIVWWRYHICGAVVIGKNWVLTAAHCFNETSLHFDVRVGTSKTAWWGEIFEMKKRKLHPDFDFPRNDIAIIELAASIEFGDTVMPIKMAIDFQIVINSTLETTGFGAICFRCDNSVNLMETQMNTISLSDCQHYYITYRSMCVINEYEQATTCKGDSGGPLVARKDEPILIGLTRSGYDCDPLVPAAFTHIPEFREWIKNETGI